MNAAAIIALLAQLAPLGIEAYQHYVDGVAVLKQAQDEAWPDNDPRWTPIFAALDALLKSAEDRLT
jgi:hypothetical protein